MFAQDPQNVPPNAGVWGWRSPSPNRSNILEKTPRQPTPLLRGWFVLLFCPWVPRGLVTHGYCCFGATRLMQHIVSLFPEDGMRTEHIRLNRRNSRLAFPDLVPYRRARQTSLGGASISY